MLTQDRKASKQYFRNTLMFAGILVLCLGCFYSALAWTEPSQTPPAGNTPTPLNIGSTAQTKTGGLTINGISYLSTTNVYGDLTITTSSSLCLGNVCKNAWPAVIGTVTGVTAGAGLTGGGATGAVTLTLDPAYQVKSLVAGLGISLSNASGVWTITNTSGGGGATSTETDPIFGASPAKNITGTQITNWDNVYNTAVRNIIAGANITVSRAGNDVTINAGAGSLPAGVLYNTLRYNGTTWVTNPALTSDGNSATANGNFFVTGTDTVGNLTVTNAGTVGGATISSATINNWNTAYTSWASHTIACSAGQAVTQIQGAGGTTVCSAITGTGAETDPIFGVSPAKNITSTQITNWDSVYTTAVRNIIAGANITVSRAGNDVTVNATGGAG
ncbi:MAG: hypothetical protein NTZ42_00190, partial [Candidatus Gribaldobacteria bacterium]|nr:hypothetical protein [Candidatus Gribaldobacteria bacterium]